jgi:hypothetical protein
MNCRGAHHIMFCPTGGAQWKLSVWGLAPILVLPPPLFHNSNFLSLGQL